MSKDTLPRSELPTMRWGLSWRRNLINLLARWVSKLQDGEINRLQRQIDRRKAYLGTLR